MSKLPVLTGKDLIKILKTGFCENKPKRKPRFYGA